MDMQSMDVPSKVKIQKHAQLSVRPQRHLDALLEDDAVDEGNTLEAYKPRASRPFSGQVPMSQQIPLLSIETAAEFSAFNQSSDNRLKRQHPLFERLGLTILSPYSRGSWQLVTCVETGFVYLANPPKYSDYVEDYAWEKSLKIETERRRKLEPIRARFSDAVKRIRLKLNRGDKLAKQAVSHLAGCPRLERRLRVVDVGCGEGQHAIRIAKMALRKHGLDVQPIGIEISGYLAKVARNQLRPYGGYVIAQPALEAMQQFQDASIDVVVLLSFLEHEINPGPLLRLCASKLSNNGIIIVKVPNFDSWNRHLRQHQWCGFRYPEHVNYFNPKNLRILVERNGLQIQRMNWLDCLPTSDNMWAILKLND